MGEYKFDKYKFDTHHHHGWDYKEFDHPEPPLLATHDQLANIQDLITQDPKAGGYQANQSTAKLPPKPDQDRQRKHGHHHIGLYCTHLPRGAIEYPTLSNVEIDHQDKLFRTTQQASRLQLTPFHDGRHQDSTCLAVLSQSHSNQDL